MNRVLITGGASGIGRHLAVGFAKEGYEVFVLDLQKGEFSEHNIHCFQVDLRNEKEIQNCFQTIAQKYGVIHVLINNGAISKFHKSIRDITIDEFDQVIQTNLRGTFICCKEFAAQNKDAEYGRIINIASTRFNHNEDGWDAYGVSKGGVVSLTNSLCVSLSNTGITVNTISPGWIQVENYDKLAEIDHKQHPSGRVGKPQDIVNACLFFSHPSNDFINGVNLIIDGGLTKKLIFER